MNMLPAETISAETITISASRYDALLFDMDGTIMDNMAVHHQAWRELLSSIGYSWSLKEVKERVWGKNDEIFERLFPGRFSPDEKLRLATEKEQLYINRYRASIAVLPGLEQLLTTARRSNLRLGIVTAAPQMNVDFAYETLGLARFFETVVHADEVSRGKPAPDGYLLGAQRLKVDPNRCLVFEDAPVGIQAAQSAQMDAHVILTTHQANEFRSFTNVRGMARDFTRFTVTL